MVGLKRLIQARKLTQKAAAKLFGVTQPRVSDLVRGKIELFSIETLVDMLRVRESKFSIALRRPAATHATKLLDAPVVREHPPRGRRPLKG